MSLLEPADRTAADRVPMEQRRQDLIAEHLVLVDHVARRVGSRFPRHIDRQDLVAAGRLGLTEAAMRFDFDHGGAFSPFAARRIRGAILDLMRSADWVPRTVRETVRRADDAASVMRTDLGRPPTDDEVAGKLRIDTSTLQSARSAAINGNIGALDQAATGDRPDPADTLVDQTVATIEEILENRELHGYLRSALDQLPDRLRTIVVGHYLEGRSLDELSELLGITASRVSQLRGDAVEIIRDGIESQFETGSEGAGPDGTGAGGPDGAGAGDRPKGRVAIRQAQFAAAIAVNADWRTRLAVTRYRSNGALERPAPTTDPEPQGRDEESTRSA